MTTSGLQPVEDNLEQTALERRAIALREVRIRTALLNGLFNKNPKERANAINNVTKLVKEWAKEYYPERSAAGTVTKTAEGDKENVSGVSSPLYNNNSSKRSSVSDGNNPLNSPLFTDGSGSASATSYAASPVVESGLFNSTPTTQFTNEDFEDVRELRRDVNPEGPVSDSFQRRKSTDMNSIDNSLTSEDKEERKERLRLLILTMLRLSIDCPFADVRNSFNKCLVKLRMNDVPVPEPVNPYPSCYISPEETITLEWPSEYAPPTQSIPRSTTPSGRSRSSSCSSASSSNSAFSEEIPRVIQPLTPSTPLYPTSPVIVPLGRQPDDLTRNLMINTFIGIGRLSHFYRILAYFPSFMEKYQRSYNSIIRNHSGPGLLPISWRFYIGIMAASQHKCRYAVSKLTDDFILCGGNIDWLRGLEHAPIKIRNLAKLNTILAHQPWRLKASDIGILAKGSKNPQDNWALAEIVHAIVILSTFHSLSSYVLGCGIVPEYDSIEGNHDQSFNEEPGSSIGIMNHENISSDMASGMGIILGSQSAESDTERTEETTVESTQPIIIQNNSSSAPNRSDDVEIIIQTNELIERLKQHELQVSAEDLNYGSVPSDSSLKVDFANVEVETFEDVPRENFALPEEFFGSVPANPYILAFDSSPKKDYFSRFLDPNIEMPYEDFDVNSSEYSVLKLGDYCWETQGVVMVNRFLPSAEEDMGIGELLDREFSEIRDLTDYRLFHSYKSSHIDLDTKPLRQAVWFYVQRLYGLLKDDYTYRDLNTFLNMKIKKFLKKICCKPEEIKFKDWRNIGFNLREEEKCHVNLIAVEARKQAELVYGLTSVTKWENERDKEGMLKNLQV